MPFTSTPPSTDSKLGASWSTTVLRRYGWPSAPLVEFAFARFSAMTCMRSRSAAMPEAEMSNGPKRPPMSAVSDHGLEVAEALPEHAGDRLVFEVVLGEGGPFAVDVAPVSVLAHRARAVLLGRELDRGEGLGVVGRVERGAECA